MRYIRLTKEEKFQLEELQKSSNNHFVCQRCLSLLLSEKKNSMIAVSRLVDIDRLMVKKLFKKWDYLPDDNKLSCLYSLKGQGAKLKLDPVADILIHLIEQHNSNLKPILEILEKEHSIKVCKSTLQSFLKGIRL